MKCDFCGNDNLATTGAVLDGKFGQACISCRENRQRHASSQVAQYHRDRDREDHQKDTLQPWVNGKINPEFARAYPEKAKDMYTEEELKEV